MRPRAPSTEPGDPAPSPARRAAHDVAWVLSQAAVGFLLLMAPFAWILRDGLGPDSTTSAGWEAVARTFWCFGWGPLALLALLAAVWMFRSRRRIAGAGRSQASTPGPSSR